MIKTSLVLNKYKAIRNKIVNNLSKIGIKPTFHIRYTRLRVRRFWYSHSKLARASYLSLTALFVSSLFIQSGVLQPIIVKAVTNISPEAQTLLTEPIGAYSDLLQYNAQSQQFDYNEGYSTGSGAVGFKGSPQFTGQFPIKGNDGTSITDPVSGSTIKIKPLFKLKNGEKDSNRIVYQFTDRDAVKIITVGGIGYKEDVVLNKFQGETVELSYELETPSGVEPRLEADGSVGFYGVDNNLLGNVSAESEADQKLLEQARANGSKGNLLFKIPAPYVVEYDKEVSKIKPYFILEGNILKSVTEGLDNANYPLTIDPSVYVETARKFMRGNDETNTDFDATNQLIQKAFTTGARFDSWNPTLILNENRWGHSTAAAGGYIYTAGGTRTSAGSSVFASPGSNTYTVPTGVTSVIVETWGGGGGGGGGGTNSSGGNGGGSGFARATLPVTAGENLNIRTGGGGGQGDFGGNSSGDGGGGGGYSGVFRATTPLIIAAGGAGGGGGDNSSGTAGGQGGAGGGTNGVTGSASASAPGGVRGTASTGGAGGDGANNDGVAGSSLKGGNGADGVTSGGANGTRANAGDATAGAGGKGDVGNGFGGGGGGGGGFFGGGGGAGSVAGNAGGGGGGGGSGRVTGSATTNTAGASANPGNLADTDRAGSGQGGAGGGTTSSGVSGSNGIVIISYDLGGAANVVTDTVYFANINDTTSALESPNPGTGACSNWCSDPAYKLPAPRAGFSMIAYNGFLYAIGGKDNSGTRQNTVFIAKIGANGEPSLWHPTDSNKANWSYWYTDTSLSAATSYSAAVAYNNRIYITGGQTNAAAGGVNTVQYADIKPTGVLGAFTSTGMAALPSVRHGHTLEVYNDNLYLIGGNSNGTLQNSVSYIKLAPNGTMLGSWQATSAFTNARSTWGGSNTTVEGGYIYIMGGCQAVNASGYCTTIASDIQLVSINADGSLGKWGPITGLTNSRIGFGLESFQGAIYRIGGCTSQNSSTGDCSATTASVDYGEINQDGDASTVSITEAPGSGFCVGADPYDCDLAPPGDGTGLMGNLLSSSTVINGYLYVIGGCVDYDCRNSSGTNGPGSTDVTGNIGYVKINADGTLRKPATCAGTYYGSWCVDAANKINGDNGVAAAGVTTFNGRIYVIGGFDGGSNTNSIFRNDVNDDGSLAGVWAQQSLTGVGATSVAYTYAYARANPSSAATNPGNLYIFGGCTSVDNGAGCGGTYSNSTYKCNIQTSGAIAGCSTAGQLTIDSDPDTAGNQGVGIHSGTVYANYIYLIGGFSNTESDKDTVMYAKFDNNNNVVAASGPTWTESPNKLSIGRRRGFAFGYNGYLYSVGGFNADGGGSIIPDIEFAKVNVSDGSISAFAKSAVTINQRWGLTVAVSNSYAYIIGGCNVGNSPSNCTSFEPSLQTFQLYNNDSGATAGYSTSANQFANDRLGTGSAIINGKIYIAGGCRDVSDLCTDAVSDVQYATLDSYGNIGPWATTTSPLPAARSFGKLKKAGNSLYYLGGNKATCNPTGTAQYEKYDGINGTAVANLYADYRYPGSPTSSQDISGANLSSPSGIDDNFGARVSALLCAPQDGSYTFWVASDDSSELRLSTDSNPANATTIASVNGFTNVNQWNKFPSQQSATVTLKAGQYYYIEGIYKEGGGGDHLEIGWQLPDATQERPIANTRYSKPSQSSSVNLNPSQTVYYATPDGAGNITSWNTATNGLPAARTQFGADVWNDRIYVTGGLNTSNTATNTVYVSPQLSSGGNITSGWTTSTALNVNRSGHTTIAYANNLYAFGGYTGNNYLNDSQFSKINSNGTVGGWTYTTSLPTNLRNADGFAANGYIYLIGGRSADAVCASKTLVVPISANTTIASGNNPTGIGEWYRANQSYSGNRYGAAAVYDRGKVYVLGGACPNTTTALTSGAPETNFGAYTFDSFASTDKDSFTFNGPAGANLRDSDAPDPDASHVNGAWNWENTDTPSGGATIGPNGGQGGNPDGYIYTEATAQAAGSEYTMTFNTPINAATDAWNIDFYWNQKGDDAKAVIEVQTNEAGAGWITRDTFGQNGPDRPTNGANRWNLASSDLFGDIKNASTQVRLRIVLPDVANVFHNDIGIDRVSLRGRPYGSTTSFNLTGANRTVQSTLLSQPQIARYSYYVDADSDVFPNAWLLNGLDNNIGARWQFAYRSSTNGTNAWGQDTNFGDVTLGNVETYIPKNAAGTDTNFARYFYVTISIDASQTYGYPDDVSRGPTIDDMSIFFTADPNKRLRHGKTFIQGQEQPLDTPPPGI